VEREREENRDNPFTPHPCTRLPEWSSLCWLAESEREEKERKKVALWKREKCKLQIFVEHPPCILKASIQVPPTCFCQISVEQMSVRILCLSSHLFSQGPVSSTPAQGFLKWDVDPEC
jgi:hypothetical protein